MTTIKILIYTDTRDISLDGPGGLNVNTLKYLLETKRMGFVKFQLKVINRYDGFVAPGLNNEPKLPQKLTLKLLEDVDEIWFFGTYRKKVEQDFDKLEGGRENELDDEEVVVLKTWMARGGVLMSGDHSVPPPEGQVTDPHGTFICLGKALGHRVPRAGQLRKWDGPPTTMPVDSFNTHAAPVGAQDPESDSIPQTLSLVLSNGMPHPLFLGETLTIGILPDHKHEGELVIPAVLDDNWPPFDELDGSKKPKPEVVAEGFNNRDGKNYPVLAVYDGDRLGVGRIVADSSWHHYLDDNLTVLPDNGQDSIRDLLGQLYQNIALYLAPRCKRKQLSREMTEWIVKHTAVQEERGNEPEIMGKVALKYLSEITTRFERHEFFQMVMEAQKTESPSLTSRSPEVDSILPSRELVVGSIIRRFHQIAAESLNKDMAVRPTIQDEDIVAAGLSDALNYHRAGLTNVLSAITP
jgi:hypothetical protein